MSYKFQSNFGRVNEVVRNTDSTTIPFDMANRDCRQFLEDWKAGAAVVDADGNPASYNEATVEALGLTPPG